MKEPLYVMKCTKEGKVTVEDELTASPVERLVMCKECIKAQVLLRLAMEAARGRLIDWTNKQHDGLFDEIEKYLKEHEPKTTSA